MIAFLAVNKLLIERYRPENVPFLVTYEVDQSFEWVTYKVFQTECLEWARLAETCSHSCVSNENYVTTLINVAAA
jgi:hypothetical protein